MPAAAVTSARRRRLIRELQVACQLLRAWETSLLSPAGQISAAPRNLPGEEAVLPAMVKEARLSIQHRLHELGMGTELLEAAPGINPQLWAVAEEYSMTGLHLNACRACGHALGAVFREAQSVADAATAHMIYRWVRAFERHLWVLDPGLAGRTFPLQLTGPTR